MINVDEMMLALCVWREARGESLQGKRLVATTILNRARDEKKRWPRTVRDVVLQPWQFSSFNANDPNAAQFPKADDSWTECATAARLTLEAVAPLTPANHYHVIGLTPAWRDEAKIVATEGHHVFYCL